MKLNPDGSNARIELDLSWDDLPEITKGFHHADGPVAAHAEITDIIKKDDALQAAVGMGRHKESADHDLGAARLIDQRSAVSIEVLSQAIKLFANGAQRPTRYGIA
jgi:hypothetical protein